MKPMSCGCYFAPGRSIPYSELRAHFDHVKNHLEESVQYLLMMELIMAINKDMDVHTPLSELRMKVMDCMIEYDDKVRPALDKKFPENKLAEALGL